MWLEMIIRTNLMKLALLLKYAPNSEVLPMTTELWIDAFDSALGRKVESLDAQRIEEAFKEARNTMVDWPSPAQVIGLMPRRQEVERLVHAPGPTDKGRDAFDICQRVISGELSVTDANALMADGQYSEEIDQPF